MKAFVIGVSGCSKSGKTTLGQALCQYFKEKRSYACRLISLDDFYGPQAEISVDGKVLPDWDIRSAIDWPLLESAVREAIAAPPDQTDAAPIQRVVIVEGFNLFYSEDIRSICSALFFLDITEQDAKLRRLTADEWVASHPSYFDQVIWTHHRTYLAHLHTATELVFTPLPIQLLLGSAEPDKHHRFYSWLDCIQTDWQSKKLIFTVRSGLPAEAVRLVCIDTLQALISRQQPTPPAPSACSQTPDEVQEEEEEAGSRAPSSSSAEPSSSSSSSSSSSTSSTSSSFYLDSISDAFFFPPPPSLPVGYESVMLPCGQPLCFRVFNCPIAQRQTDGQRRALVFYHGNGEGVDQNVEQDPFVVGFRLLGYDLVLIEYRGYGFYNRHLRPALITMLSDVPSLHAKLKRHLGIANDQQLVVMGRSMGTLYAGEHARLFPEVGGLILESGFSNPAEWFQRRRPNGDHAAIEREATEHLDNGAKLASDYRGRLLVLHARDDRIVPCQHATRNYEMSASPDDAKRLVLFDIGDHNWMRSVNFLRFWSELAQFCHPEPAAVLDNPWFHQFDPKPKTTATNENDDTTASCSFS